MDQLGAEINRISTATTFAGTKLLDGTFTGSFQVGADANQTISFNLNQTDGFSISGIAAAAIWLVLLLLLSILFSLAVVLLVVSVSAPGQKLKMYCLLLIPC